MTVTPRYRTGWFLFLAGLIVTIAVYTPGLSGSWLFDDFPNIVDNPGIQIHQIDTASLTRAALSSPSSEFHRPLASITFALNYLTSGFDPLAWKITNVVIHLVNGVLFFWLARLLLTLGLPAWRRRDVGPPTSGPLDDADAFHLGILAALIASAWMLLPINLTAVLYVVQRMTSLANVFVLLGLIGYVTGRRRMLRGAHYQPLAFAQCVVSLVLGTAIGFTAKETAVLLPLYALLVEWVLFGFRRGPTSDGSKPRFNAWIIGLFVVVLLLPFIVGLVWLLPSTFSPGTWARRDFDLGTRLLSEARIVTDYIVWTFVPAADNLSFYHDGFPVSHGLLTPWTTLPCIIFLAALLGLAIWLRKRAPLASLGLLLFFAAQTLTGTILPLELVYEHRNYFASFGLMLAVIPFLAALPGQLADTAPALHRRLPMAMPRYTLLGALCLWWIILTTMTAFAWGNPLRLAETLAARAPHSPRAQYQLGRRYIIESQYNPASPYTRAAYAPLERAAAMPESSILPQQALIFMNARMHLPIKDAWWDSMIAKLKARDPGVQDVSSLAALTTCARDGGCDLPENRMVAAFLAALSHPHPKARLLAIYSDYAWNVMGDHALGERMAAAAAKRDPGEPAYHITLARMFIAQGHLDAAKAQLDALKKLNVGGRLSGSIMGLRVDILQAAKKRPMPHTPS
ncbi:MAG TPA: hypothetical protein VF271_02645 [Rhodanobacteraceae bacterium]